MKKLLSLVLVFFVFFAGCTTAKPKKTTTPTSSSKTAISTSEDLTVYLTDLVESIYPNSDEIFKINLETNKDIEITKITLLDLGEYLESSCEGVLTYRDLSKDEKKQTTCSIKMKSEPDEIFKNEISYSTIYKLGKETISQNIKIHDETDSGFSSNPKTTKFSVGSLIFDKTEIEEGESVRVSLKFDKVLYTEPSCDCSIEDATLTIPPGFTVIGLSNWKKFNCGDNRCYSKSDLSSPSEIVFSLSLPGVTQTSSFEIGLEIDGIWKELAGTEFIEVHPHN